MNAFKRVRHPLRLTTERGWKWGGDPRRIPFLQSSNHPTIRSSPCLISPHGTVFECRLSASGLVARRYQPYQLHEN